MSEDQIAKKRPLAFGTTLCANMTETLAPLFITVEGQEGISHGKDHE